MIKIPEKLEFIAIPDYVKSWSAASIPNFVHTVLDRWEREFGALPDTFCVVMCPQVEINSRGGLPDGVYEYIDPKLTCRQFTGCHKPYFFAIFLGANAMQSCIEVQESLAWSEAYQVTCKADRLILQYLGSTEDLEEETVNANPGRLKELVSSGQIIRILE